jgi:hypothetical protein
MVPKFTEVIIISCQQRLLLTIFYGVCYADVPGGSQSSDNLAYDFKDCAATLLAEEAMYI